VELTPKDLEAAGLLDQMQIKASTGFVNPQVMGIPYFDKNQLKQISKMLNAKALTMSDTEIDSVIAQA